MTPPGGIDASTSPSPSGGAVARNLTIAAACIAGAVFTAFNVLWARSVLFDQTFKNDFRLYFGAALVGLQHGWSLIYDPGLQRQAIESLPAGNFQPFVNPPPMAWLVAPFTAAPFPVALAAWTVLMLGAMVATWWLLVRADRGERLAHLLLALGFLPAGFALQIGQAVPLIALAVAISWALARRDRTWLAGLALLAIWLKPQDAILVPVALLVCGQWRVFAAWATASLVLGAAVLATLGFHGVDAYGQALSTASQWDLMRRYSLPGQVAPVAASILVATAVLGVTVVLAHRLRGSLDLVVAAGVAGSLLFSAYLGIQDMVMMLPAAWLVWRHAPGWHRALTVAVYFGIDLGFVIGPAPVLIAEVAWLASLGFISYGSAAPLSHWRRTADQPATG